MSVRIDRIKVNRDGPLGDDFVLNPASFNLIYGGNETGKTYLVEAIIRMLFGDGKKSPFKGLLRPWGMKGTVRVVGLPGSSEATSFTKTTKESERFGSFFENTGKVLPPDFAKLLVVRGGESNLSADAKDSDGVGENILRNCLSGEGLLDELGSRIPANVAKAEIHDGILTGPMAGLPAQRESSIQERNGLDALLKRINQRSSGAAQSHAQAKEKLEEELAALEKAKRHAAYSLQTEADQLEQDIERLPASDDLVEINGNLSIFRDKSTQFHQNTRELDSLAPDMENLAWIRQASQQYSHLIEQTEEPVEKTPGPLLLILASVSFLASVVCGFIDQPLGLGITAALALVFAWLHFTKQPKGAAPAAPGMDAELQRLRADYQQRFGEPLTSLAALQACQSTLAADGQKADVLRENLGELEREIASRRLAVKSSIDHYLDGEIEETEWEKQITAWSNDRSKLEKGRSDRLQKLAALQVPKERFLTEDPGIEWDPARARQFQAAIEETVGRIAAVENESKQLRADVSARVDGSVTDSWEQMLAKLEDERRATADSCKSKTAEIIGLKCVSLALDQIQEDESERITNNLSDPQLQADVFAVTGRYEKLLRSEEGALLLRDRDEEEYPLSMLSTGAREQVMLALRAVFASKVLGDDAAFLILDDAFQHADWKRRDHLVRHTIQLVKDRGWQVFYFTMDDHLRDLFRNRLEAELPSDHQYFDLSNLS
jgi:uncharacterized protein YhaN